MTNWVLRACAGMHLAESSLWLAITNILMVFEITPPIDPKTGKVVLPPTSFTPGVIR